MKGELYKTEENTIIELLNAEITIDASINVSESEIDVALSRVNEKLQRYTNYADKADYAFAIASGIMAGILDSVFVGETIITGNDIAFIFISELGKEKYSRNVLDGLVFPPTRSDWGDFSTIHEAIIKEPNIGFSNKIRYNDGHDIAYMHLWKNVDGGFLIDQPHKVQDITALTFVKESEKYGWRIYKIGEPADHFKETGSLFDWLKYVIKELRKS